MTKKEKIERLICVAFDVLEHDSSPDDKEYERAYRILLREFSRVLGWKLKEVVQENE